MADTKLSDLTPITDIAATDNIYVDDAGASKKITWANLEGAFDTPALGTPASGVISACTSSGMVLTAPVLGTPASGVLTNCTGYPDAETLKGRHHTIQNTTLDPLVMGARYIANNHAGITYTAPAAFAVSATAFSDIQLINADNTSDITLTPSSGDAFFVDGATHGVDTTYAVIPGAIVILSPRTTNSEWDLVVYGGGTTISSLDALGVEMDDTDEIYLNNGGVSNKQTYSVLRDGLYASPTLVTPALGTPASGVLTNCTGTASGLTAGNVTAKPTESLIIAASDETSALTVGDGKIFIRMPYAFTLTDVRASVTTAPTGAAITVDVTEAGSTIFSTLLTIDATEKTSTTAATPAVISDSSLADDAEIGINVDVIGSTIAGTGLKVTLIGTRT